MATMVESAILRVVDQSSGPLSKINSALNQVLGTAGKLANVQAGTRWNFSQAIGDLSRLAAAADRAAGAVSRINAAAARSIGGAAGSNPFAAVAASTRAAQSATAAIAGNVARAASGAAQFAAAMQRAASTPPPKLPPNIGGAQPGTPRPGLGLFGNRPGFHPNAGPVDRVQNRAVNGVEDAITTGMRDVDTARSYGNIVADEVTRKRARDAANQLVARNPEATRGFYEKLFLEISTGMKPEETGDIAKIMPALADVINAQTRLGNDPKQARDGLIKLVKGANVQSLFTDNQGKLNDKELIEFFHDYIGAKQVVGGDIDPNQAFLLAKYSRTAGAKQTRDERLRNLILSGDIGGSSTGVMLETFRRAIEGQSTKEALKKLADAGVITGEMKKSTPSGPGKFVKTGIADQELFDTNQYAWFEKKFLGKGGVFEQAGVDPDKASAAQIARVLSPLFSNRNAHDLAQKLIQQRAELKQQMETARRTAKRSEDAEKADPNSWQVMQNRVSQIMGTLAGDVRETLKPVLVPIGNAATRVMQGLSTMTGSESLSVRMAGIVGGAAVGGLGYLAANPGHALLMLAGGRLIAAANRLSAAAIAQGAGGGGGILGRAWNGIKTAGKIGLGALGIYGGFEFLDQILGGVITDRMKSLVNGLMTGNYGDGAGLTAGILGAGGLAAMLSPMIRSALFKAFSGLGFIGLGVSLASLIDDALGLGIKTRLAALVDQMSQPGAGDDLGSKIKSAVQEWSILQYNAMRRALGLPDSQRIESGKSPEQIAAEKKAQEDRTGDNRPAWERVAEQIKEVTDQAVRDPSPGNKFGVGREFVDPEKGLPKLDLMNLSAPVGALDLLGKAASGAASGLQLIWQEMFGSKDAKAGEYGNGVDVPAKDGNSIIGTATAEITASMQASSSEFAATFESAGTNAGAALESAGVNAGAAVSDGGASAAGSILDALVSGGAQAADAIAAAVSNINLNVSMAGGGNTGTNANLAR
jgi:hypothetical protein